MLGNLLKKYKTMNKQIKVVFWFSIVGFLQRGISLITTPIFTRVLSTDEYLLFSVFNAWYPILVIITTLALNMGVINNAFIKKGNTKEKVVSSFQSLSMVIAVAFFIFAVIFRNHLSQIMNLPIIIVIFIFLGCIFYSPYHDWVAYKRYQFDYVRPVIAAVAISVLTPLVSLIAIYCTDTMKGEARVISYVLVNTIFPGLFFYIVNYKKDKTFCDKSLWIYALSFNVPLIAHYMSETLLNQTDRIMINMFCGKSEAGIYSVAFSAASIFTIFTTALNASFVPWTYQKLKVKDYKAIGRVGYLVLLILVGALSVMIIFAPEIIRILAGEKYSGAVYLIPTLGASVYFNYMYQLYSRIELYYEKKAYTVTATITAAVLNIVLNVWWIPKFGYLAAGYSTLIAHIVFCVMHYFFFSKVSKEYMNSVKVYDIRIIAAISAGVLMISFVMTYLYQYFILRIIILTFIVVTAVIYRNKLIGLVKLLRKQ